MSSTQSTGQDVLSAAECLLLLQTRRVGRLGFMVGDQPLVLPVNFVVDAGTVVLRTGVGAKLHNAPLTKVAFEVDHIDEQRGSGWSVVIQGVAQDITTGIDSRSEQLRSLAPEPWAEGERDHYVRVVPREISGRRVER